MLSAGELYQDRAAAPPIAVRWAGRPSARPPVPPPSAPHPAQPRLAVPMAEPSFADPSMAATFIAVRPSSLRALALALRRVSRLVLRPVLQRPRPTHPAMCRPTTAIRRPITGHPPGNSGATKVTP